MRSKRSGFEHWWPWSVRFCAKNRVTCDRVAARGTSTGIKKIPIFSVYFLAFHITASFTSVLVYKNRQWCQPPITAGMPLSVQNPVVKGVFEPTVMSRSGVVREDSAGTTRQQRWHRPGSSQLGPANAGARNSCSRPLHGIADAQRGQTQRHQGKGTVTAAIGPNGRTNVVHEF